MNIIPKLNLNKNFKDADNCCIVNANNMTIDENTNLIRIDNKLTINEKLINLLNLNFESNIVHVCPTQNEIIFFIQTNNEKYLNLYRYNEVSKTKSYCGKIEYNGGKLVTTFTYNKGNLILSISEYDCPDDKKVPLRVVDLDEFVHDKSPVEGEPDELAYLHSICPEVRIPSISCKISNGLAYKGWYYIFIRYKISENNYTQWFNTNGSIFIDNYETALVQDYKIAKDNNPDATSRGVLNCIVANTISDNKEICTNSFINYIENLDRRYGEYQLGFVVVSKTYTHSYRTNDIDITTTKVKYDNNNLIKFNLEDLVKSYFNYYNVKTLDTYNNQLYIANYEETNENIDCREINLNLNIDLNAIVKPNKAPQKPDSIKVTCIYRYSNGINIASRVIDGRYNDKGEIVIPLTSMFVSKLNVLQNYNRYRYKYTVDESTLDVYNAEKFGAPYGLGFKDFESKKDAYGYYNMLGLNSCEIVVSNNNEISNKLYYFGEEYENLEHITVYDIIITKIITDEEYNNLSKDERKELDDNTLKKTGTTYILKSGYSFIPGFCTFEINADDKYTDDEKYYSVTDNDFSKIVETNGIASGEWYNFYIHFINKYGEISSGYNINKFKNVISTPTIGTGTDNVRTEIFNNDKIIYLPNVVHTEQYNYDVSVKLDTLPDEYIGYFVSYEKVEKFTKFKGVAVKIKNGRDSYHYKFYNDNIFSLDKINFDFNTIRLYKSTTDYYINDIEKTSSTVIELNKNSFIADIEIDNKQLFLPDTYNNIGNTGYIKLIPKDDNSLIDENVLYVAHLCKTNGIEQIFKNKNKILIPCSDITYIVNEELKINTKNAFISTIHSMMFYDRYYWHDAEKVFKLNLSSGDASDNDLKNITYPFYNITFKDDIDIPNESLSFNNEPAVEVFPVVGLNTDEESKKGFSTGNIVEIKNTIDLYKQNQVSYIELYPKVYANYNKENSNYEFGKTIRRSNVIADESKHIGWRFFDTENYKNINENKGNIVKLVGVGNIFLVHTEHSIFQFNADATIKANEGDIALASQNVWDVNYRELVGSKLGHYGIVDERDSILGSFGYIFYDRVEHKFYRFDNNSFNQIDDKINQYIRLFDNIEHIDFINDEYRNRLLIIINYKSNNSNLIKSKILSYNYKFNTFVSFHDYNITKGYNTKSNLYLINYNQREDKSNIIYNFDNNNFGIKSNKNEFYVSILINNNFDIIKSLESISYKINKQNESETIDNYFNKNKENYYSGDILQINSDLCSTGEIDIHYDKDSVDEINKIQNYKKPYYEFGNWNFSLIRDKLNEYIEEEKEGEEHKNQHSLIYGNWFIITFKFNIDENHNKIELEFLDYKLNKYINNE